MTISYNGEDGEVGSYQQNLVLDTSKFPVGSNGYFTVQVGEYDSASESYTASEVYKFNVTRKASLPVIRTQPQAESESMEYSEFGGAFLEVEAEATDNGELSYKWYKVSSPEDEELSDDYAMDSMCLAPLNTLGKVQYYCVVTNTVEGEEFSVKTDVVTIYVYKSYIAKLNLYENGNKILDGQGYWQGKEFNINVDSANTYKLEILPINKEMVGKYSMTIRLDGKEYKAKTNNVSVRANLTKYIHAAEVIGQPGTYVFDENAGMVPGGYTAITKGNSAPKPFNVRFQYADYDVDSIVTLYHSTTNSYDGAELVKDAICKGKREGGVSGEYFKEYEINPNTAYPTGEHYFYVVITLSPSDKNSTVKPVSTKSDILKIDFTDRETTMDGAGTEQNPYIIKTTEHLSEIQKMVADRRPDSFLDLRRGQGVHHCHGQAQVHKNHRYCHRSGRQQAWRHYLSPRSCQRRPERMVQRHPGSGYRRNRLGCAPAHRSQLQCRQQQPIWHGLYPVCQGSLSANP